MFDRVLNACLILQVSITKDVLQNLILQFKYFEENQAHHTEGTCSKNKETWPINLDIFRPF